MIDAVEDAIEKTKEEKSHMSLSGNPRNWMIGDALDLVLHGMQRIRQRLLNPNVDKTVYTLIIDDRHYDPKAHVFLDEDYAIEEAKRIADKRSRDDFELKEEDIEDWLYFCRYSIEGDSLWVKEEEVQIESSIKKTNNQDD